MCGILGTVDIDFSHRTLDLLKHRGPDGEGRTIVGCGAHQVRLGHRRLAIVELTDNGAQPMSTPDGTKHLVFNGEIYNHQELRRALSGVTFRGHSDTETLLHALAQGGVTGINQLNGIFAFGYVDTDRRKLFLVRDPFGVKPVYYSASPRQFCFASEIRPLLGMVDDSLDSSSLASLLALRFVASPRTLHRSIRRVRPGHVLEVDLGGELLSWREYPYIGAVGRSGGCRLRFEDAVEEYGRLFERAVSRQLMSDVEVGVLLSGGVDSAIVAANAQRLVEQPMKAFTVGFEGQDTGSVDEIDAARETARCLGMEHHFTRMSFENYLETLRSCVGIVEEPLATTSIVPMHYLAGLAGRHVKVVMSGQGADEPLGGYRRYQVELYRRLVSPRVARVGSLLARALNIRSDVALRALKALSENDDVDRFLKAQAVFTGQQICELTGVEDDVSHDCVEYFYQLLGCEALPSSVERMMVLDARLGLADDLLLYTDKITMHHSIECRVPMLDTELMGFLEALPWDYRVRLGKTKIVHKAYASSSLPASIVNRRKLGFESPTRAWFKDSALLRSTLLDKSSQFAGIFNLDAVNSLIEQHQQGINRERQIFLLLCLYYWFEARPRAARP